MAKTIQQVKQELEALEQTVTATATQLQNTYEDYLDSLSASVEKQLILAGYQLCTQIYAESFLQLSFSQREKLQQELRELVKEVKPELKKKYRPQETTQEQADLSMIAEMLKNLPLHKMGKPANNEESKDDDTTEASDISNELADLLADDTEGIILEKGSAIVIDGNQLISIQRQNAEDNPSDSEDNIPKNVEPKEPEEGDLSNPQELITWQKNIENQIKKTLDNISTKANKILQEKGLISQKLPTKVMEIALQNADTGSRINKVKTIPNILNLVIEIDKGKKSKPPANLGHISLLRLKLTEIEFADPNLSSKRNEIRNLLKKISRIQKTYQEKKHEHAMAEADAAWRSSWYED